MENLPIEIKLLPVVVCVVNTIFITHSFVLYIFHEAISIKYIWLLVLICVVFHYILIQFSLYTKRAYSFLAHHYIIAFVLGCMVFIMHLFGLYLFYIAILYYDEYYRKYFIRLYVALIINAIVIQLFYAGLWIYALYRSYMNRFSTEHIDDVMSEYLQQQNYSVSFYTHGRSNNMDAEVPV